MKKLFFTLFLLPSLLVGCGGKEDSRIPLEYSFSDQSVTYDGEEHSILVEGDIPEGIEITYTNNGQINAGEYVIGASINDTTGRYKGLPEGEIYATLTINKAELDKDEFFPSQQIEYDANAHSLSIIEDKLPSGLTAEIVETTTYSAVGTYEYTAIVTDINEHKNYVIEESYKSNLVIGKITLNEDDFLFESVTAAFDGSEHYARVTFKDGTALPYFYDVQYTNNAPVEEGEYTASVTFGTNEDFFTNSLTLTTTITITEQVLPTKAGDKYYFGRYPQKVLRDSTIFSELQKLSETDKNENGYYVYNGKQYDKISATSPMTNPMMEGYGEFSQGQTMYFEVKPICWIVCEINNGQYLLRSEKALDCVNYYDGDARTGKYNSDYSISTLRAFLNGLDGSSYSAGDFSKKNTGFLPRAFNTQEANKLVNMTVQNSNGGGSYVATNTVDKVKVISESELKDALEAYKYRYYDSKTVYSNSYYSTTTVDGSQYAIAKGAHYRVEYGQISSQVRTITRSPHGDTGHYYLQKPLTKFGSVTYSTKTNNSYAALIPIITVTL